MAEAKLNFNEDTLSNNSGLYSLYNKLYEGMRLANEVDAPDYIDSPPTTETGEIDSDAILESLASYSTILMKNSAYLMANAIIGAIDSGGSGGTSVDGFVSRSGDNMEGLLNALYGFQAGDKGEIILEVRDNSVFIGSMSLGGNSISFNGEQVIYYENNALNINGDLRFGNVVINENGISYNDYNFYHEGNCNKSDVDWIMDNAFVHGNLEVFGTQSLKGYLSALHGFELGDLNSRLLHSERDEEAGTISLVLDSDLHLKNEYGIKFDNTYIVKARNNQVVSFMAPGMIMNLGDTDENELKTQYIALQTDIRNYAGDYNIITPFGDGNFPNSLSVGCANSGPTVLRTYYSSSDNCGIVLFRTLRFGDVDGPAVYCDDTKKTFSVAIPYSHIIESNGEATPATDLLPIYLSYKETTSLFKDQSLQWSASLNINTDAEFISLLKPVESVGFSIISEKYKTRLIENTLFFNDNIFLEGLEDGVKHQGNSYFSDNLSSRSFSSGFAGNGWGIIYNRLNGNIAATFDELTIRKKMRIYEQEVQRQTITNGSLWVSDSCSGDFVEEIV